MLPHLRGKLVGVELGEGVVYRVLGEDKTNKFKDSDNDDDDDDDDDDSVLGEEKLIRQGQ